MRATLTNNDKLFIYLAGHGSDPRITGDWGKTSSRNHFVQFNAGEIYLSQIDTDFTTMANNGVQLTVMDGSCNGGETVINAIGQNYCALSTVSVKAPGLTNFPSPGGGLQSMDPKTLGVMGFWTNSKSQAASVINGALVPNIGDRIAQRIHRNDTCAMAETGEYGRTALGWKIAVEQYNWGIRVGNYSIFKVIYPTEYSALSAADKASFTRPTSEYLILMNELESGGTAVVANLKNQLKNDLINAPAAKIYSNSWTSAWRTMAGDLNWDVSAQPTKYLTVLHSVNPADYLGTAGFSKMSFELMTLVQTMEEGFSRQVNLLSQIDAAYAELSKLISRPISTPIGRIGGIIAPGVLEVIRNPQFGLNRNAKLALERHNVLVQNNLRKFETGRGQLAAGIINQIVKEPSRDPVYLANRILDLSIAKYKEFGRTILDINPELLKQARIAELKAQIEAMIAIYKAITPILTRTLERTNILLSIYEDSVCAAQSGGKNPCDVTAI